jgi:hypothetical protein
MPRSLPAKYQSVLIILCRAARPVFASEHVCRSARAESS